MAPLCAYLGLVGALLTGLLSGCGEPDVELDGLWVVSAVRLDDETVPVGRASTITLEVRDGEWGGFAPCNDYGGPVEVEGSSLRSGALSQTFVGCPGGIEAAYVEALGRVDQVVRTDDGAVLTGPGARIDLDASSPVTRDSLGGTTWSAEEIRGSIVQPAETTLIRFGADDVTVSIGCDRFTAGYRLRGSVLDLQRGRPGPDNCSSRRWAADAVTRRLQGDHLAVRRDGGRIVLWTHGSDELVLAPADPSWAGGRRML